MRFLTGLTTLAAASFGCWANASQPEPLNAPAATEIAVNGVFSEELEKQFYDGALAIARKKIAEGEEFRRSHPETAAKILPRLATGGGFGGLFVWDTAFCVLWAKYDADELPVTTSLDNFYRLQRDDGFICREFQADGTPCWGSEHPMSWNPPILAWAEWELFQSGVTDAGRLKKVYPALKKNHEFCRKTYRRPDGLYFSDALGGGMDNLDPAFDFFKEMAQEGRLDAGTYSQERMDRAEIDVLLTWDYLTLQYRDLTKASVPDANIECHVMKDGALQSGYALVINKYAPHPYAAAATVEYLLSDEGQINRAEGYARPIRSDVELPAELSAKMIPDEEYTNTIPLTDNDAVTAACTEIATRWEEEIIPLMG